MVSKHLFLTKQCEEYHKTCFPNEGMFFCYVKVRHIHEIFHTIQCEIKNDSLFVGIFIRFCIIL